MAEVYYEMNEDLRSEHLLFNTDDIDCFWGHSCRVHRPGPR
jgi:hypothetical protein